MRVQKEILIVLMAFSCIVANSQQYKLRSAYLPVEYAKNGKWYKVKPLETKLQSNTLVRCKSDFTIQEVGGAEKLHFCPPSISAERLGTLINKNAIKKAQSNVGTWFRSGSAYEIAEVDIPIEKDSLSDLPYNLHYLLVDVHHFEDGTWGDLGLPNVDVDKLDLSLRNQLITNGNYILNTRKVLFTPSSTTADSIKWNLDNFVNQINEEQKNFVILYLSSHGELNNKNELCFISSDSKYDFYSHGKLINFLSGKEINNYVRKLVEKRAIVLVFLDACYAGALVSELDNKDSIRDGSVVYYMSTEGDLKAYQDSEGSPFAEALINAISNEEQLFFRESDNVVTPYMLGLYIQQEVNAKHKGQNPKTERGKGIDSEYKLWVVPQRITKNLVNELQLLAEKGNADAMVEIGDIYYSGNEELNVAQDYGKAYNYYKVAFNNGNKEATAKVGICHYYGHGVAINHNEAFKYFQLGEYEENDLARYYLGVCYTKGVGTKISKKKAKKAFMKVEKWYDPTIVSAMETERVMIPGVNISENNGFLSHFFDGKVSDGSKVVTRIRREVTDGNTPEDIEFRAKLGKVKDQAIIGHMYLYGNRGMKINYAKAVYWLRKAELAGSSSALLDMGYCYLNGFGVKKDSQKAWDYFNKSAEKGYSRAFVIIGNCYFLGFQFAEQNDRDAAENWRRAASLGDIIGMYKLGLCYKYGIGVEQNEGEAIKWLRKSAQKGYERAQYELGKFYLYGGEYKIAYKWLNKSKKNGSSDAKKMIDQYFYADGRVKNARIVN